jgi:hypothetical protein
MTRFELLARVWSWVVTAVLACVLGVAMAVAYWVIVSGP